MNTQDVKDYFYRHFMGTLKVDSVSPAMDKPQVFSQKRSIEVYPAQLETRVKVAGATLLVRDGISCSSRGFRFADQLINVNEAEIKRYAPGEIALHTFSKKYKPGDVTLRTFSKLKIKSREGTKQMSVLPQERANRLQWQRVRPKREGEAILAWFGPIVEDAVAKLTLNKRRGTLLIWYNPQSRHFDVKGLYLYRRMGMKENPEWRWM